MKNIVIRVAIIGVVIVGGLIFRDRLSGNATELQVGDCFDDPAAVTQIKDVQHHPCTEGHTSEVIFVGPHPAAKGTPFSEAVVSEFVQATCLPAFFAYVGSNDSDILDLNAFFPVVKDWDDGDRGITCYLYTVDGSTLTKSLKAA